MVKDEKSIINKMEKLRRILDNPFDPNNKEIISNNEDKTLETIRRKLSSEPSISKADVQSSESSTKQSANLKPTITVHKEKEKITKTKQLEVSRQDSDKEDITEVEKVEVSKPELVEKKSEETVKKTELEEKLEKERELEQKRKEEEKQKEKLKEEEDEKPEKDKEVKKQEKTKDKKKKKIGLFKRDEETESMSTVVKEENKLKEKEPKISELDEDIEKLLPIIDNLLDKLPDDVIDKFAQSKDFELYEKVMLKLKNR